MGLSQDTDLLNDLQKEALLEPTEAAQSPYMDDPAYAGFETLRGLFGSNHGDNPSMYWLAQGEEMPEFATVADAQAAVWKDFQKKARAYQAEQERQQQAREALAATIDPFIDRYVRGDAVVPSPEQVMMMQEAGISWESVRRARRGMQLVREYDAQGTLYDDRIINNLAEQVGDDELARRIVLNMFYNDARKYAKDKHGDEWTGIDWIDKAAQGVTGMVRTGGVKGWRTGQKAWRNLQVTGEVDAVTNAAKRLPELIASGMDVDEARAQIEKDATFLEIRRRWAADLVQTMEAGEKEYLEGEDRHLVGRIGSQLGSIIGDTAPWFIPAIGPAIGASSAMQSRRDEGVSIGLTMEETEKRAMMFGQADALEEMIAFSPIGRLTPGYKWLKKALGGGKAAGKLAPWRARWMASPKAQYAIQGLSGAAEEAILEPTAGYLMRTVQSMNLTDERGKQTFRQYLDDMGQMMHGEQGLALLAFTFGMSGLNYPQIKKAAQEFGLSLQHYKELGGTAQGYLEAREEKTAEGFLNKALANLHDSWMEDPQASLERASAAAGERLSGERIESLRELDAWRAAEDAGMVPRVEPAEQEGMFRVYAPARSTKAPREDASVSRERQEEGAPSYTLMDGEQTTAYLQAFVSEQVESDILYTQHLLAGDVTVSQALAQGRFDAAEVITHTVTDEQTGAERVVIAPETLGQMKARADMAMAAIRALEAEGVSYEDAAARMDASLSEHLPLGTLVKTWEEAQERIRTEQARNPEFKAPAMDAPFSNAYVTKVRRGDTFRRVLRYARGNATVEDLMEETMEQAVISWQAEQGLTWGEFGAMLQEAQRVMNDLFPEARGEEMQFIHLDAGKPVTAHDAIEAFSKIGRSRWLADAVRSTSLPSWLRKLLNHLVRFLGYFKARVELGEMVRQAEEQGVFTLPVRQALAVMLDAGNALYRDQQGDLIALTMERAKAQADLDAALGRGVATEQETLEEQLAERNAADEPGPVDRAEEEADDANAQQARRERTEAEVEMLGERDDDGVFNGGVSIRIEDGVRQGFIDKDRLTLCPDVPQFKQGADEKTGVVNRIVGTWQRNAAPISVWRRTDGSLQVISGRHRLDACTDADINCTVYEEGKRFDLDWARRHDVENNIRDGQASAFEIARYVRDSSLSMAEAVERGIARKGASLKGVELGLYASQELLDALGNGLVSPDDAYRVALAFRNDAEVQRSGLAVLLDGGSWQEAYNTMAAKANLEAIARQNAANGMDMGMDLFGNTDNEELYKRIGKYAAEKYRELGKELTAINGASRNPKVARKYGVNVNDAAAVQQVVKRLQEERSRWKNFAVHPDLLKEANDAVMVELGVKTQAQVDQENGVLPLEAPEQEADSDDAGMLLLSQDVNRMLEDFIKREEVHFSLAGENEALLAPNGEPSHLTPQQYRQVRTPEFKRWFGDWEKVARFKAAVEKIMSMDPVAAISGQEFQKDGIPLTEKVTKFWKERFNGVAISPELGEVRLDLEGVKSSIGHGIGSLKSAAFACVEDVIRNGVVFDRQKNWKERGYDTAVIAAPVTIKGVEYVCEVVVEQRTNRQGFYLHEVEIKKKLEDVFKTSTEGGTPQASRSILALRAEDVKREEEGMSKVVDENGEPLVVYHGSPHVFTVFDVERSGENFNRSREDGGLLFFSSLPETAEDVLHDLEGRFPGTGLESARLYACFMRLRRPFTLDLGDASQRPFSGEGVPESVKGSPMAWYLFPHELRRGFDEGNAHGAGYDGIVLKGRNAYDGSPEVWGMATDSRQVKSAADNRGTFDSENPDITFSIIGEKAESFMEYHNNGLSYTDPADGKRKAIIDSRGVRLRKEHVSVSEGGHVNVSLAAALDFPELFRAYPELRKLRVDFYRDSRSGTGGFTDPQEHYIAVNVARGGKNADAGMVLDTILHEVQHVIQGYEGFAQGAGSMSREQALAYLGGSMGQLAGRGDDWAKAALPRLERMKRELEAGTLQPAFVYVFSHGEQEARLAGTFEKNSEGVLMSGLNGFRLLDAPQFSIPLTGDITELGGITFGAGRFGRMAGRVLAPNGDWLYDEMVFRMRAATQRSVSKLRLFETGDRELGLELLAEAQELISTVERFLPHTYGFGLEPYKIWLNVFSLLYGNSGKMAPGDAVASALEAIPMRRWPEIMEGSIGRSFVNWAEKRPELEDVVEEARREIAERQADYELDSAPDADNRAALAARKGVEQEVWRRLFEEHGAEFLEEYGEQKVFRLVGKFMERVVEQIDRFRKDRTLGRIRRVAASVAPRTSPQGKPMRGKMDAESYRRLEERLRLLEMTPAQYDAFFRRSFPEVLDGDSADGQEGRTLWEEVKPQDFVTVETTDAEGGALTLTVTKATFEAYACYEKMNVETAENASRALGEFIATRREAWENAAESKRNEVENMLRPVLAAAGNTDDQAMASSRKKARLKTLPSGPMSLVGYLMNFSQYMQALQSVPAFRGIAKDFERRAARFAVQKQAAEKDALDFVKKAAGRVIRTTDEYEIADWIYEQRRGADTGLTITEQEPDWQGKAREEYRAGVLGLIRRKVRKHGAAKTLAHVAFFMEDMDEGLKEEIRRVWPDARDGVWSEKDAAVFTEKERERYGSQKRYVAEHAAKARKGSKWGKEKRPYQPQSYRLNNISRMEAAYILLLSQQEDYQEMLRLKGFTQDVLEALEAFAGKDVMEFSRALREKLNERGMAVKEMTEKRYGTPFPLIENYFRAFFDVGIEAIDKSIMDAASYGDAATGGKFGLIHARKKHQANLDLTIDVLTAYYAAMNEQDVYLHGSEISRDMRALINYRGEYGAQGARVLEKVIGRDALHKLLVWCDSFDKGMAGNVRGFLEMQKSLNRISSAAAITLLPGRVGTWVKQSTALINAAFSSDEIDPHEWAASMARMAAGRLVLSPRALMERAALDARDATGTAVIREAMSADEAGRSASGAWKKLNVKGMNLLTQTDVGLNAVSSAVLYDAVYRKEMKRHPGLSREEADRRAMMEVELSLSRKAQPMTPQQRSLAAQTRSVWNVGVLFLGGESINTFAETVALWKQGGLKNKAKSVSMFYAHGLLLAAMSAMLNFFTDDERRRKRREWWHIFIDAVQGPLQGIPFLGALAGGAIRGMSSLCGYRYYTATTSLVPFASWDNLERAGKDLVRLFDEEDKDWEDFPLAFMGALRMAAFGAALGGASSPKGAKFKAAAYSAAAFLNLTEFLLRAMKGLPLRLEGK